MSASSVESNLCVGMDDDEGAWSPWPDLPPELSGMVFCRLPSYGDRLRFQAVCRRWRHAARQQHPLPPPPLPWLALDRTTYQSLPDGEVHRVPVPGDLSTGTVCRGSFDGWLLYDSSEQLECFLMNPISKAKIDLPYHWYRDGDETIFRDYGQGEGQHTMSFRENAVRKIVVCSPDLVAAIMAAYGVFFHRPGMHSTWSFAAGSGFVCDIAFYGGKLYSVSKNGELFVHEFSIGEDHSSRVETVIDLAPPLDKDNLRRGYHWLRTFYLVVSCTGKLLMVRWRWHFPTLYDYRRWCADELRKEIKLDVFEADLEKRRWSEVKDIGDQALFLDTTCSKALPSPDHGNCIFFLSLNITKLCSDGIINGVGDCAYCVYDMKNHTLRLDNPVSIKREESLLPYGSEGSLFQRWRADWFFPCE